MSNKFNQLVKELKDKGEDFEFYPTTQEIIEIINESINGIDYTPTYSISDAGGGLRRVVVDISWNETKP